MAQIGFDTTRHNASVFDTPRVASWYARQELFEAEAAYIAAYAEAIRGRAILDLGVGAGRTSGPLLALSDDYLGVDLSRTMLRLARQAHPEGRFQEMDVRAIGKLGHARFGFVHGGLAILSAFTHEERLRILASVRHVLAPDGLFIFSAHNRAWRQAGAMPIHSRSWRPRQIVNSVHPASWFNYGLLRRLRREQEDHAILVDPAHHWSCVFYYIDHAAQRRQLQACGFTLIETFGEDGRRLAPDEPVSRDGLLHYVCRPATLRERRLRLAS